MWVGTRLMGKTGYGNFRSRFLLVVDQLKPDGLGDAILIYDCTFCHPGQGVNTKYAGRGGNDRSGSSSKVSSSTVPSTPRTQGEILQSSNLKSFSFNELKAATRNFRPDSVLGEGGFGCVFKGWIDEHSLAAAKPGTGIVIAVKRLSQESFQGHQEWLVSILPLLAYF
ncbi:hypothetical protein SADUNF_Sadunf08G0044100 [Salix dunnii]|uniref:Uncharacterized protein n=1 Tax=Salix dunnii TaxID=1413687 RepID=A0A835JYC3_9ROSI|nr:hypothetical protein SADUNF_Sadunf08G0044100 [Salix dunnii]